MPSCEDQQKFSRQHSETCCQKQPAGKCVADRDLMITDDEDNLSYAPSLESAL
uniref:Uncharacterized protein n=1 Tax=Arundo donax TaxID=35708 RepID=A0A0A9EII7_ARUDO